MVSAFDLQQLDSPDQPGTLRPPPGRAVPRIVKDTEARGFGKLAEI